MLIHGFSKISLPWEGAGDYPTHTLPRLVALLPRFVPVQKSCLHHWHWCDVATDVSASNLTPASTYSEGGPQSP